MNDWEHFSAEVTWYPSATVVGSAKPWARGAIAGLPGLSELLQSVSVTPVSVGESSFELLAWGPASKRRGWLCNLPVPAPYGGLHPTHRELLSKCGGIRERFGCAESWWENMDQVLTEEAAASTSFVQVLDLSAYLWEGAPVPIDPADYYVVAEESNGNLTAVERTTGNIVMLALDHSFTGVTPLPGCPEYSLMAFDEAPTLETWIETCVNAMRS